MAGSITGETNTTSGPSMVRHEYIGLTTSALYNTPLPVRLPVADLGILESVCVWGGGGGGVRVLKKAGP